MFRLVNTRWPYLLESVMLNEANFWRLRPMPRPRPKIIIMKKVPNND